MNRNLHKKLTFEDKFARKYYCNSYRFIRKMKKANNKKLRKKIKTLIDHYIVIIRKVPSNI